MSLFESASFCITPNGTKASKLYAIKPTDGSGDLSVTRATSATRVNASGLIETVGANVPRLDYSNGSCPSILIEPQRTNLNTYSEDFSNGSYTKISCSITANATIAPDGNTTADKIVENNDLTAHTMFKDIAVTINNPYTLSVFAKSGERTKLWLDFFSGLNLAVFDLSNGTVITTLGSGLTASIVSYGNGWYRCSITQNAVSAILYPNIAPTINNTTSPTYQGNGTSGIYIWGAQLEAGSYATSYIPTTSASVTRNADVISKTGISSLIGQTEGTIFCDVNLNSRVSFTYLALSTDLTTSSNYLGIGFFVNSIAFESVVGAALQANIVHSNSSTGRFKIAAAYKNNDFVLYINGTQIGTDTSGTVPACSQLGLNAFATSQSLNYNSVQLYKTKLSNTQLAELTTI